MTKIKSNDNAFHPAEILRDAISRQGMSINQFAIEAQRLGLPASTKTIYFWVDPKSRYAEMAPLKLYLVAAKILTKTEPSKLAPPLMCA